jgi:D-glycerate 3-kinase
VNDQLAQPYALLWHDLTQLTYLAAPDMEAVHAYRAEQESALQEAGPGAMNPTQLRRFVQHFERLTLHMLRDTPSYADVVVQLDAQRRVLSLVER